MQAGGTSVAGTCGQVGLMGLFPCCSSMALIEQPTKLQGNDGFLYVVD